MLQNSIESCGSDNLLEDSMALSFPTSRVVKRSHFGREDESGRTCKKMRFLLALQASSWCESNKGDEQIPKGMNHGYA